MFVNTVVETRKQQHKDSIMFDINTINTAIAEAVKSHIAEVLQQQAALTTRLAALEEYKTTSHAALVSHSERLDDYSNINAIAEAAVREALGKHIDDYDHDSYDEVVSTVEDHDLDDFVTKYDVYDIVTDKVVGAINESLCNAEVTIRVR